MSKIIITCEHGGNTIPVEYKNIFYGNKTLLNSHEGYDKGALQVAELLSHFADYHRFATISRLLVDLNRSQNHPNLFSRITKCLDNEIKKMIIKKYYSPYRDSITNKITAYLKTNRVIHISIHSFTPILNNHKRNAVIGILYDPKSSFEKMLARKWKEILLRINPSLKIRFNYPYLGTADGFTSYLRKHNKKDYYGLELEIHQDYLAANHTNELTTQIKDSFILLLDTIN